MTDFLAKLYFSTIVAFLKVFLSGNTLYEACLCNAL